MNASGDPESGVAASARLEDPALEDPGLEGPSDPLLQRLIPRPRHAWRPDGRWRLVAGTAIHLPLTADIVAEADAPASDPEGPQIVETAVARLATALRGAGLPARIGSDPRGSERLAPEGQARVDLRIEPGIEPGIKRGSARIESDGEATDSPAAESYRLEVGPAGLSLIAADAAGLLHGSATLAQWIALAGVTGTNGDFHLPALQVEDAPVFLQRGVMLDISRDKVPTRETLHRLVRWLSGFKVNQFQLYMEHTFAYAGHDVVWRNASPLTGEEIEDLDDLCRRHAIELVPNQNSFGHLHRWLVHPEYRPLAECPGGVAHPWAHPSTGGPDRDLEPFSLCATDPASLDLLADLYRQLLPHFRSQRFNVGLDETFDLGRCRSREEAAARGRHRLYLDFVTAVGDLAAGHGREIQLWADGLFQDTTAEDAAEQPADPTLHAESADRLPAGATALLWGHEAGFPFADRGALLAGANIPFLVCPGTSSWTSLGGRLDVALTNLAEAGSQGQGSGATGYLVTDWGDFGHLQPLPVSFPPLLAGAAAAWNPDQPVTLEEVAGLVNDHAFGRHRSAEMSEAKEGRESPGTGDPGEPGKASRPGDLGAALEILGTVYRLTGGGNTNGSALFRLLLWPQRPMDHAGFRGLTRAGLEEALAALQRLEPLAESDLSATATPLPAAAGRDDASRWGATEAAVELDWVRAALVFACQVGLARIAMGAANGSSTGPLAEVPTSRRRRMAAELDTLLDRRRRLWLQRNRPGGLDHALGWLAPLRAALSD